VYINFEKWRREEQNRKGKVVDISVKIKFKDLMQI
jgi:hypothetical protein